MIKLSDLDAAEYDDLVWGVIRERDRALAVLRQVEDLNEEAHRDGWSALGLYSGIAALLRTAPPEQETRTP